MGSLVAGVREGRRIFLSIKKFVVHVLATNVGMVLLLMIGLSFRDPDGQVVYPQSALEILILNMYVLSLPLMGLVTEPPSYDVMMEPPRRSRFVLTKDVLSDIIVYGLLLGACGIACFTATLYGIYGGDIPVNCLTATPSNTTSTSAARHFFEGLTRMVPRVGEGQPIGCTHILQARGATFLAMSMMLIFSAYNNRDAFEPVWRDFRKRPFNKVMFICSVIVFLSVIIFIYVPGLNTIVFHHFQVYAGWGPAAAALLLYMTGCTFWKLLKRKFIFPSLYISAKSLAEHEEVNNDSDVDEEEEEGELLE